MFVDASVIIAIIGREEDALLLSQRLDGAPSINVSAVVFYEAVTGLARQRGCSVREAEDLVSEFLAETDAQIINIDGQVGLLAVGAFTQFGRGRHKARLNMGDCFVYACAKAHGLPLLFKGNDFGHTDIMQA
jgi:ribonuclease VapC